MSFCGFLHNPWNSCLTIIALLCFFSLFCFRSLPGNCFLWFQEELFFFNMLLWHITILPYMNTYSVSNHHSSSVLYQRMRFTRVVRVVPTVSLYVAVFPVNMTIILLHDIYIDLLVTSWCSTQIGSIFLFPRGKWGTCLSHELESDFENVSVSELVYQTKSRIFQQLNKGILFLSIHQIPDYIYQPVSK